MSHRNPHKRTSIQLQKGTVLIAITLTVLALILTFFSLRYHNQNATNGYQLKKTQEERSLLLFEIETLEMEIADLGALQ